MLEISQQNNAILRQRAVALSPTAISSPATRQLIAEMSRLLAAEPDGVALAAPQVGASQRLFIVSGRIADQEKDLVFINPEIIRLSKKRTPVEEGCLSVRWWYGRVARAEKASVRAYDEKGKKFIRHGSGLMAQIFQHEIDHLDGILFIDKAKDLTEVKPERENHA